MKTKQLKNWKGLLNTRIIAVLAILVLVVSYFSFSAENSQEFKDVPKKHWAHNEIQFLTQKGIIRGYGDGTFGPEKKITRLQAVTIILREKGITDYSNVKDVGFIDVKKGGYGYEIISKAVELGIINGKVNKKGQKYFDPSGNLTRGQMASILTNAYDLQGSTNTVFKDVSKSHWAYNAIQALVKNHISTGYGNGKFGVNDSITRTQFSVMMARMLDDKFAISPKPDTTGKTPTTDTTTKPATGKVYPDGWTAPVLKSSWSSNHQTNLATLQNELGFTNNGMNYTINKADKAISIIGNSPSSSYELDVVFYMWDDDANGILTEAYRVPIVAKELFELYFGNDATKVWNYFNNDDIPDNFTANGRKVHAYYSSNVGALTLEIGRK